nr:hypothetical protein [Angustibacter aerolatus]
MMGHLLSREGPILTTGERQAIIRRVVDEALGLGILEPLLADPSVTEIMVNGHETIFVERAGVLQRLDAHFANEDHHADHRPDRRGREPPRRRVEPHGRRAPGDRRARQRDRAAARPRRADAHHPAVPPRLLAGRAWWARARWTSRPRCCWAPWCGRAST